MKRSLIERKLGRVETALDKAIEKQEIPGAVVLARMPRAPTESSIEHWRCTASIALGLV